MFEDEPRRPEPRARFEPARLQDWSDADLRIYIADLKAEIAAAEAAIAARSGVRAAADAFFRKPE